MRPANLPPTIAQLPFFACGRYPASALIGRTGSTGIRSTLGRDLVDRIRDLSLGLSALGLARGDRVLLLSESRPEWLFTDFAVLAAGAVTTPVYPTLPADQVAFILEDSGASMAVVSTSAQMAKLVEAMGGRLSLRAIVVIEPDPGAAPPAPVPVLAYDEVAARGHRRILDGWGVGRAFHEAACAVRPADLATLVYTSGTTGTPKGVELTHGNLVANMTAICDVLSLGEEDTALSILPLCHAFERMVAYVYLATGVSVVFAESPGTLERDLPRVRPTIMTGVPRVLEKLQARVLARGQELSGLRRLVFDWALRVAMRRGATDRASRGPSLVDRWRARLAERAVFRHIRDGLGGRLRFFVSGGAPLRPDLGRFFVGVGVPVLQGYGLTETSPVISVTTLDDRRLASVGRPLPGVEVRIADDGEVLVRGPSVMGGYHGRPDETAAALEAGWFHTGDIGRIDAEGYLYITDRRKDVLVTSNGKKIAPAPIEAALSAHPLVAEAVLLGDARRFLSALLVPDFAELSRQLAVPVPEAPEGASALVARPDVRARYQAVVDAINASLAPFEQVRRFTLLAGRFTVASGELTPTLKVRRRAVESRYRDVIEAMYG